MDSVNSGSMQSSSGGDEEYDSRFEQTPFGAYNSNTNVNISSASTSFRHQSSTPPPSAAYFDNLQGYYLDHFSRSSPDPPPPLQVNSSSNPLLNLDWVNRSTAATALDNQRCYTETTKQPSLLGSVGTLSPVNTLATSTSGNQRLVAANPPQLPSADPAGSTLTTPAPRGSKKRPRASRRAPTTVLTTDTTNFRQMVQEFTGIPSPPFSSSTFPRSRFDLFNSAAAALRSSPGSSGLLRPFAQKVPIQIPNFSPFLPINSSSSSLTPTTSTPLPSSTSNNPTAPLIDSAINYQLPPDLGGLHTTNNIHPIFTFQSLLQTSNNPSSSSQTNLMNNSLPPQQPLPLGRNQYTLQQSPLSRGGGGGGGDCGGDPFEWGSDVNTVQQNHQVNNSCKTNNSTTLIPSSSDFHGDMNRSDHTNVSSRGDGLLDSWISSSD